MATWHQSKNAAGLTALWQPHPTQWKCVSDKPNQFASSMTFDDEHQARAYSTKTGAALLPPLNQKAVVL